MCTEFVTDVARSCVVNGKREQVSAVVLATLFSFFSEFQAALHFKPAQHRKNLVGKKLFMVNNVVNNGGSKICEINSKSLFRYVLTIFIFALSSGYFELIFAGWDIL